MLLLKKL